MIYHGLPVEPCAHDVIEALNGHVFLCQRDTGVYEGGIGDGYACDEAREGGECSDHFSGLLRGRNLEERRL